MNWLEQYWLEALGWGGSALLIYSLLQQRVLRFRSLNLVAGIVLVVYNAILWVWPMVALNLVTSAINLWFIAQLVRQRHDDEAYAVIEVRADDQYLQHVLDTHAGDIRKHQPSFTGRAAAGEETYVVVKGDETVGVVILQPDGDVARVRLDYVTPKYQDFTPGEFVWRRSDLMRKHGYRRVVTSPDVLDPYYDRIGFRREGDVFVLDLPRPDGHARPTS